WLVRRGPGKNRMGLPGRRRAPAALGGVRLSDGRPALPQPPEARSRREIGLHGTKPGPARPAGPCPPPPPRPPAPRPAPLPAPAARLERGHLLGRVDAGEWACAGDHADLDPALERAELLEPLGPLERARRPRGELEQERAAEGVHADVTQRRAAAGAGG